jgi:surface antigen
MTTATDAYAYGNCTYYVATRYPQIYPYLGDAKDWLTNAVKQGYPILGRPAPDTVVVYGVSKQSPLGHVAVVDSLNADGSFNVSEMNNPYNGGGYNVVDTRRSKMDGVVGFIVPPGSSYTSTTADLMSTATSKASSAGGCVTGGPNIFGAQICMDGAVGILAMGAGGLLMVAGVIVFSAFALNKSGLPEKVASSVGPLAGPWGAVASLAVRTSKPAAKPTVPSPAEGKAASDARVATAKARLSTGTQTEIDAAKRGEGKRLSTTAREELTA